MKLSKLIIPLLGITSITNANKRGLFTQLEKGQNLETYYQVFSVENEPSYFNITTNKNVDEVK